MKTVKVDDVELRCDHTLRPGAPALLLLNSLGTTLEMWDDQFEALAERYELIRYDVRGHGKSTLGGLKALTIERLARDALAVLDACGVARAHLCGLSLGGMTSMYLCTNWPDRVLKGALCNTSPCMPPPQAWDERIQTVMTHGMNALVDGVLGRWFTPEFRATEPARVLRIRDMLLATPPQGYAACCAAIRDMDQRDSIKSITTQTLVIGGDKDPATTPADAQLIASSIAGAKLVMLDAAHLSNVERPAEFTAAIVDFLGEVKR